MTRAPIVHGGRIDVARRRFPQAPEPWIDLSTGINPVAYPLPAILPDAWARLPTDADLDGLLAAAAARYRLADGDRVGIVAAPGTQSLIQLLPRLRAMSRVAVVGPTYQEHAHCWSSLGHEVTTVGSLDAAMASGANVVIIVNPDNPSGRFVAPDQLGAVGEHLARRGGLLVVDEAFIEAVAGDAGDAGGAENASLAGRLPPATIVLRSFGKIYGLAGVRLGFAIAEPVTTATLRGWLGPWAVPGPAIVIGRSALSEDGWLAATRVRLGRDAQRLDGLLVAGRLEVVGGTLLFRLARAPGDAALLADRLAASGILVRVFPFDRALVRFGLPAGEDAWQRLSAALSPRCPS